MGSLVRYLKTKSKVSSCRKANEGKEKGRDQGDKKVHSGEKNRSTGGSELWGDLSAGQ